MFIESKRLRWADHFARMGKTEKFQWIFFLQGNRKESDFFEDPLMYGRII
jgi:hypothetical protein